MGAPSRVARAVGRVAAAARIGARTVTPLDTNPVPASWRHITKVDPEDEKQLPLLYPLYLRHTSAVSVGGSRDVNRTNTEETFQLLGFADVPVFHEPSAASHVTEGTREMSDFLAIPEVLNGDSAALIGRLGEGAEYLRGELVPGLLEAKVSWVPPGARERLADFVTSWLLARAVFEAYIIQNPESAAAREAGVAATDVLTPGQAAQRAQAAERHLESEVVYVEYSGTFGGDEAVELLEAVTEVVSWPRVWYGGGLDSREHTSAVLEAGADAVVVGNVFHAIAEDEADLCARAAEELPPDAATADVRAWVAEAADPEATSAADYLATVPGVADPGGLATDYAAATVDTWLGLRRLREAAGETVQDASDLERFVDGVGDEGLPGAAALAGATGRSEALARAYAAGYLADALELELDTIPLAHVGVIGTP